MGCEQCQSYSETRYNEGRRDWQTLFAITRFRYIEVLTIVLLGGKKIVRYTDDFVLYRSSLYRGSTRSISSHFRASNRSYAPGPHLWEASTLITVLFFVVVDVVFPWRLYQFFRDHRRFWRCVKNERSLSGYKQYWLMGRRLGRGPWRGKRIGTNF